MMKAWAGARRTPELARMRTGMRRGWRIGSKVVAWLVAACCVFGAVLPAAARGPLDGGVVLASLPREARNTYSLILSGGPFPYAKDGVTFGNREGALPRERRGYYHEYTVPTPGARNRGARRIVCGGTPADWGRNRPAVCYYSDDHYATFRQIRE
jgi:ribonuclease T1